MTTFEIQPVERREWWPTEYMDEIMPNGRTTPTAWIFRLDDGAMRVGEANEPDWPTWPIAEGEIVSFVACDTLGKVLLTFDDDGSASWTPRPPDDAHLNDDSEWEMGGDGPDDFVRIYRDFSTPEPGKTVRVSVWRWSEEVQCRFTALDGPPRFVAIPPLPTEPEAALTIPPSTQTGLFAGRSNG